MDTTPSEGWYPDPADSTRLRRWDGVNWTNDVVAAAPASERRASTPTPPPPATDAGRASAQPSPIGVCGQCGTALIAGASLCSACGARAFEREGAERLPTEEPATRRTPLRRSRGVWALGILAVLTVAGVTLAALRLFASHETVAPEFCDAVLRYHTDLESAAAIDVNDLDSALAHKNALEAAAKSEEAMMDLAPKRFAEDMEARWAAADSPRLSVQEEAAAARTRINRFVRENCDLNVSF